MSADWWADNAPSVVTQPSKLAAANGGTPVHVQATPATTAPPANSAWWDENAPNPPQGTEAARSRTLLNMTAAMSGQPLQHPEDQAAFESGKEAGMESAAVTAGTTIGSELLLAPRAVQVLSKVPAGRDPVTGRMLPWIVKGATEEGSSLAKAGYDALKAAGEAHPLVKQLIIQGLGTLGAGGIAKAMGWIGKATAEQ